MSDSAKKAERKDAFTLSMVDLFGCGFISAIFLFIFNMIQPALDAIETGGIAAGLEEEQGTVFSGQSGAAFILVSSSSDLVLANWETGTAPDVRRDENATLSYNFEQFVADVSRISWPLELTILPKDDSRWIDLQVTVIFGTSVATVALHDWDPPSDGPLSVTFGFDGSLRPGLGGEFAHLLNIDVVPERSAGMVYGQRALVASNYPFRTNLDWIGPARRVSWRDNAGVSGALPPDAGTVCTFALVGPQETVSCTVDQDTANELNEHLSRSVLWVGPLEERG